MLRGFALAGPLASPTLCFLWPGHGHSSNSHQNSPPAWTPCLCHRAGPHSLVHASQGPARTAWTRHAVPWSQPWPGYHWWGFLGPSALGLLQVRGTRKALLYSAVLWAEVWPQAGRVIQASLSSGWPWSPGSSVA